MNDLISRQAAIDAVAEGLKRTFVEYRDAAEKMLNKVPSAQPEQKLWKERYEDLLEYFHDENIILKDRKEFKAWLERGRWHVLECDKLARQLEAQPEIIRCRECQHWKQGELVDKCGLLDCYADADCYCAWAVRERRQDDGRS